MNITLPCALVSSVQTMDISIVMLYTILLAIIVNFILFYAGYFLSKGKPPSTMASYGLNVAGFNIGNFAIPFAQSFYDGYAISYISMFDVGNSFMGLGLNYCIASMIAYRNHHQRVSDILRKLLSSIPFDTYLLLFFLSVTHLHLPQIIVDVAFRIGSANTFLSMFMVGVLLDFHIQKEEVKDVLSILLLRLSITVIFILSVWFFLPVPDLAKQMLMISLLSPTMSVAPLFSYYVGYKGNMPAIVSSLSMLISIIMISLMLMIFQFS